jgi:adenylate kinase
MVVLMGLPGSGKGTQAQLLADSGWSHINVGGLVRSEVAAATPWGIYAANVMRRGDLLPSGDIQNLVARELKNCPFPVVIEGYPRRLSEARTLPLLCGRKVTLVPVFLKVPRSTSIARLTKRLMCGLCGRVAKEGQGNVCPRCAGPLESRPDDRLRKVVERRLQNFERETVPLIAYYEAEGEVEAVDSTQDETKVHEEIIARIIARSG